MACVYKYNNQSFETLEQLVSYISDNKLEGKISELVKQLEASAPFTTTDAKTDNNIFEEVHKAHYGDFIYQSSKFFEKEGLITPNVYDNGFAEIIKEIAKNKGLDSISTAALLSRINVNIFENRILNKTTGIQELIEFINEKFNLNIKLDSSDYEKLSNELEKSETNIMLNVMGNKSLSDAEKIKKANDNTLLRNNWIKETTKIINTILSQVDPSIPKLEPVKATKENTASISSFDRKDVLDNFITNLKHKNKDSHKRVMAVLNKYGISFDDFIKDIESYYKGTKTITPVTKSTTPATPATTPEYKIVEYKTPTPEGHKFGISDNGLTVPFFKKEAAEEWIKNKQKEKTTLPTPSITTKVSSLKNASKNAVDNGNNANSKKSYRKYFEKTIKEKENIEEFKKWLSSVLPQVSLEISDKIIDGMAFGSFVNGVIALYENAEKGTGFHEAFEAVWNSYLTPEQKKSLVEEYKTRENYQKLPAYIWANQTYPDSSENNKIKEALAEEFIDYVRDGGKTTIVNNNPVRNTLFRKFLNFIKKLWNHIQEAFGMTNVITNPTTINSLFKEIVSGQYANKTAINTTTSPQYRATVNGTSVKFTHDLMEGMTSYFFSILYNPNINDENSTSVKALFDKNKPQLFNDIYNNVVASIKNDFGLEYKRIEENYIAETGETEDDAENHIATIPEFQYRNTVLDNFNTDVKEKFKLYLSQFGLQFKEIQQKQDEEDINQAVSKEETSTDRLGIVDAIYIDPRNMTKNEVKLLIASIASYSYEENSKDLDIERNELGLPVLKDFGKKINLLLNDLTQIVPLKIYDKKTKSIIEYPVIKQMFDKLDKKYKNDIGKYKAGYEWIDNLKFRLAYNDIYGNEKNLSELNHDQISLLMAFETSFTTNKNLPYKLIVGKDGAIYADNTLDSINAKRIREKWENNVKGFAKPFSYLTQEDLVNAPMIYINKEGIISINNQSKEFIDLKESTQTEIQRLKKFGIEFNVLEESLDSVTVGEAYRTIYEYIRKGDIKTFDDLFGKQIVNSSINYLTKVEADLTGDETLLSVRNAEGKQQYSITQTSAISNMVNSFNSSKSLADFIASNEHLGTVDLNTGEVILHPYVQNSFVLKKGGNYFDNNGNKRKNSLPLEYRYILGMSGERDAVGESTDVLTFPDKIAQEIYHLLDGTYYTIINSDKASELGLYIDRFIPYTQTKEELIENEDVLTAYKNALYDEVAVALYEKTQEGTISKIKDYSDNVKKLGHFRNILKLEKNIKLNKKYEDVLDGEMTVEDFVDLPEIETLIVNYLNFKIEKTKQWLVDTGVVTEIEGGYKSNYLPKEKLQELGLTSTALTNYEFTNLVKYLVINRQLGVFEQHKLIYGHPELYKDLAKRTSGANSQTQVISENLLYLDWMDENMKRYDGLSKRTNTFRYTSYNDPEIASIYYKEVAENIYKDMIAPFKGESFNSDLKKSFEKIIGATFNDEGVMTSVNAKKGTLMNGYIGMVENDGGSYIMPDFFRDLHFLSGKENKDQSELLDYENASEILDRSNPEHPMYNVEGFAKSYSKEQINKAKEIKAKGKPAGVMLQVLKPYGFGYNKTTAKRTHTSLLKNSVVPLTWSRVVGKENMLEKYLQAQKDNIDIIAFEGSQKVGFVLEDNNVKAQDLYDNNGHINTSANPIQEMYTRYFGFQVEMASLAKDKTIFGTQMKKITLSNLPEELKEAASEYNKLIDSLTEIEFKSLLKEVGLRKEGDTFIVDDIKSMLDLLRSEVERRDLPENIKDLLVEDIDSLGRISLKYKLDASPISEKLNNILNAVVDSRILAQEMNGKAAIQIPATMFETSDRKFTYLKDGLYQDAISGKEIQDLPKEQKDTAKIVSSDLEFYKKTNKDGKEVISSMEVYAPWFLKGVNPEDVGFELKNGIWMAKDPKSMESFLKSIGFRIPTQGMNSIDSIIIKGFLPEDWGDSVIVPSEIVAKAGSDFDIDKLNMFFKNLMVKDGKIVEIEYDADLKNIEKRYNRYINSEYGDILNPLKKILSNIKTENKKNDKVIKKLKDDIDFAEKLLLKGDSDAGKLIANLFKLEIANFNDLMNADIELQSLQYEGEYLSTTLENAIDEYNDTLELIKSKFTLEEFSKLPIEQQNSKKAIQNRLIDLMSEILTHPSNFRQLTSPNSTSTAKPLAEEIRKIKNLENSETDKTALSEWDVMANIREAYITGKKLVGVIALQITSHSISQYGEVKLTGFFKDEKGEKQPIVINLNHTSQEDNIFILNLIKDENYQLISELLSESMNGAVDAAKDPFIFDLNLTLDTASTWFYLQKLGTPIKDLAYLHNQPAIVDYIKAINKNKSIVNNVNNSKITKANIKLIALTPYIFKAFSNYEMYNSSNDSYMSLKLYDQKEMLELLTLNKTELYERKKSIYLGTYKKILNTIINTIGSKKFTQEDLKNMINPVNGLSVEQSKDQIALLRDYLEYQKQGQHLSDYIRGVSYDTVRNKNLSENKLQENRYRKIVNDGFIEISSLEGMMNKTFLSKIKSIKDAVPDMFKDYFVSLHPKARPFMQKVFDIIDNTDEFMTDDDKILLLNRFENFFLTYLTHVVKLKEGGKESSLNSNYLKMFMGANSIATTLKKYQKIHPDNKALQTLFGIINSDVNSTNNVKIFNTKMSTYEINTFGESLVELYDYADRMNDEDLKKFVQELSVFSILQSGVQQSPISFTKILPLDYYSSKVGDIFNNFLTNDDINFTPDTVWKQFNQNNYHNSKLVETIYKQTSFINDNNVSIELLNKSDKSFKDDYVVVKYLKKELIGKKAEVDKLIKNKKWDDIHDTILYQKIKLYDSTGKDIGKELPDSFIKYTPINILGNRMYLTEAYATPDVESIIKSNIKIDESQYTQAIEDHKRLMSQAYRANQNNQSTNVKGINIRTDKENPNSLANRLTNPNWYSTGLMDVETPYKARKTGVLKDDMNLIYELQVQKFQKNPELIDEINAQGGLEFIKNSSHNVGVPNSRWEGNGMESNFIKVLAKSYTKVAKDLGKFMETFIQSNITFDKQYQKINSYLSTLLSEKLEKLGGVEKIIQEYENIPFETSEEQYIESLKCNL